MDKLYSYLSRHFIFRVKRNGFFFGLKDKAGIKNEKNFIIMSKKMKTRDPYEVVSEIRPRSEDLAITLFVTTLISF